MLPLVLALLVPASFARIVEARLANTTMHVADWWADDLNGDDIPESIAFVCDDEGRFFLVRHGADLLESPVAIDGRNGCPKPDSTPVSRVTHAGVIAQKMDVHHGRYDACTTR